MSTTDARYPIFHQGTSYVPRTGLALLEQGEAVVPKQFNPAVFQQAQGGADVAAEIRALREDNRAQAGEIVRLQGQIARLLSKWDGEGVPAERVEVVA